MDQLCPPVQCRKDLVAFGGRQHHNDPHDTQIAIPGQPVGILGGAEQGNRHGVRIASGLRQHLAEARQDFLDIPVGSAPGDRRPAVAITDCAACGMREGAADEDEIGRASCRERVY